MSLENLQFCKMLFKWRNSNESSTEKGEAFELGLPTPKGASLANVDAKVVNKSECVNRLGKLFAKTACFTSNPQPNLQSRISMKY